MKEIYLLSGLGADKRVFDFVDFSGFKVNHIQWIDPLQGETIERYAQRLLTQIKTERPTLIGVSFGGMMAIEIAKLIDTGQVILISSAKTKFDIPVYFRLFGKLRLNSLMPSSHLKVVNRFTFWLFGTTSEKENELVRTIIKDTDPWFMKWAIDKIVNWRNTTVIKNLTHIHGTADKILPHRPCDFTITDGGHLMIINRSEELSGLIRKVLNRD